PFFPAPSRFGFISSPCHRNGRRDTMSNEQKKSPLTDPAVLVSSLKVGALSACAGLTYGGASGILRATKHPIIHSISHGIHWAAWGTSFWWMRNNIISIHYQDNATPKDRVYASAVSGGLSGGIVTRLMGGKFTPGLVLFSLFGYVGQKTWNFVERRQQENEGKGPKPILQRMAESKWVPLRSLSDDEFRNLLNEKLLSIEVDISLLDEKIQSLERERALEQSQKAPESSQS
ncbi:uncharacterized protein TRUGW13939_05384, partial [Talaromyces rugulosus]